MKLVVSPCIIYSTGLKLDQLILPLGAKRYIVIVKPNRYARSPGRYYASLASLDNPATADVSFLLPVSESYPNYWSTPNGKLIFTASRNTIAVFDFTQYFDSGFSRQHIPKRTDIPFSFDRDGGLIAIDTECGLGLFTSPKRWSIRRLIDRLPSVEDFPGSFGYRQGGGGFCQGSWVASGGEREDALIAFKPQGTSSIEFKVPHPIAEISTAVTQPVVACSTFGGMIATVDLESGTIRQFRPHLGAMRNDIPHVKIDGAGRYFVSYLFNKAKLVLTTLADGHSHVLLDLPWLHPAPLPEFCLLEDRLITLANGALTEHGDPLVMQRIKTYRSEIYPSDAKAAMDFSSESGLRDTLQRIGLGAVEEQIVQSWLEPVQFQVVPATHRPVGVTHFGGVPDLPAGFAWPSYKGQPMSFFAQINLAEIARLTGRGNRSLLPSKGSLVFFIALEDYGFPLDIGDAENNGERWNNVHVTYFAGDTALHSAVLPSSFSESQKFDCRIARAEATGPRLPDDESVIITNWQLTEEETEAYCQLLCQANPDSDTVERVPLQMMGYPKVAENNAMETDAALYHRGLSIYLAPSSVPGIEAEAAHWVLLLQLPTYETLNLDWAEAGELYIWIRRDHLRDLDFDHVFLEIR